MFVVLTSISFESPDNQNKFILVKQSEREGEGWVDELFRNIFQSSSTVLDIEKWRKEIDEQITSRFKQIYRTLTSPRVTQIANLVVVADDELEQELWYQSGGWRALSFALLASRRGGKSFEHYISSFSSFFTSFNLYAQPFFASERWRGVKSVNRIKMYELQLQYVYADELLIFSFAHIARSLSFF